MTVYVDDMYQHAMGEYRAPGSRKAMKMSHMVADTREELEAMARTIGLNVRHIQKPGTSQEHFDICKSYRDKAVAAGAVEVGMRTLVEMTVRRRVLGQLGAPRTAHAWHTEYVLSRRAQKPEETMV